MRVLLFGKKSFNASPRSFAACLHGAVDITRLPDLERTREWLVFAGQLEQCVHDANGWPGVASVTNHAAAMFLAVRDGIDSGMARQRFVASITCALAHLTDDEMAFRIPEGFGWYALYPDSYARTAERWAAANHGRRATVIGLRSIGTSLSAIVEEQLRACGHPVRGRLTVRPNGDPFRRRSELPEGLPGGEAFIVVDEGPGLSGSSMAGVATVLHDLGVKDDDIIFFPGHGAGPGSASGPDQRQWWQKERCWCTAIDGLQPSTTKPASHYFVGYAAADGALRTTSEVKAGRQSRMSYEGLALPCLAAGNGWMAVEELGKPLTLQDAGADMFHHLATYISAAALTAGDLDPRAGLERIAEALTSYVAEYLAEIHPGTITALKLRACAEAGTELLCGDGRLGLGCWVRLDDGRILKRNATGSDLDHDWPGAQSLLWDVAGAAVEWRMTEQCLQHLLDEMAIRAGPIALDFHRAGYCCRSLAWARHVSEAKQALRYEADLITTLKRMMETSGW